MLGHGAFGAHHERLIAPVAELILALSTGEVHATTAGQCVTEFAVGTVDAVNLQVLGNALVLLIRVVALLPLGVLVTGQTLVLFLPLDKKQMSYFP